MVRSKRFELFGPEEHRVTAGSSSNTGFLRVNLASHVGIEPTPAVLETAWTPCPVTQMVGAERIELSFMQIKSLLQCQRLLRSRKLVPPLGIEPRYPVLQTGAWTTIAKAAKSWQFLSSMPRLVLAG